MLNRTRFLSSLLPSRNRNCNCNLYLYQLRHRLLSSAPNLTAFDRRWQKLTQAEKDLVAKEYEHLQKGDWKGLTIDQKRIRT